MDKEKQGENMRARSVWHIHGFTKLFGSDLETHDLVFAIAQKVDENAGIIASGDNCKNIRILLFESDQRDVYMEQTYDRLKPLTGIECIFHGISVGFNPEDYIDQDPHYNDHAGLRHILDRFRVLYESDKVPVILVRGIQPAHEYGSQVIDSFDYYPGPPLLEELIVEDPIIIDGAAQELSFQT